MFLFFGSCSIIKTKTYIFKTVRLGSRVCENVHEDNCNCTTKPAYKFRPSYRLSELPKLCWVLTIDTVSIVRGAGWCSIIPAAFFSRLVRPGISSTKPAGGVGPASILVHFFALQLRYYFFEGERKLHFCP